LAAGQAQRLLVEGADLESAETGHVLPEPLAEEAVETEQTASMPKLDFAASSFHRQPGLARASRAGEQHRPVVLHVVERVVLLLDEGRKLRFACPTDIAWHDRRLELRPQDGRNTAGGCLVGPNSPMGEAGETALQMPGASGEGPQDGRHSTGPQVFGVQ